MSKTLYKSDKFGNLRLKKIDKIDYVNYWDGQTHSTFDQQKFNVNGVKFDGKTKLDVVIPLIEGENLLEIGACPGVILTEAKKKGLKCVGIITETPYLETMRQETGCEIIEGYFPDVDLGKRKFDTILALDVLEHIEETDAFIDKCKSLLAKEGKIILMLPLSCDDVELPVTSYQPEHIWLFNKEYFCEKYKAKYLGRWTAGHEIVVISV